MKLTDDEIAELLDDNRLRMMRTDVGMARLRALALEAVELRATLAEHACLHKELNAAIHPKADGPEHPSLCDLVAFVRADMKELASTRLALQAKIESINHKPDGVIVVKAEHIDRATAEAVHRVIAESFPPDTKAIICSSALSIEAIPAEELRRIGLVPINRQNPGKLTH